MKILDELNNIIENALLEVEYKTHIDISKMTGSINNIESIRERIISDTLNRVKIPLEQFIEKHFIEKK